MLSLKIESNCSISRCLNYIALKDGIICPNFILVPSGLVTFTSPDRALTDPIG